VVIPDHELHDLCSNPLRSDPSLVLPYRADQLQPASIDLLLADDFRIFKGHDKRFVDLGDSVTHRNLTHRVEVVGEAGFVLHPGEFVLASTQEVITLPDNIMARVEGKSSLGRLGLIVHATAGFIDPGFSGQVTLEMTNLLRVPIVLRPGISICQVSFSYMNSPVKSPYNGHYQGQRGVTESRYEG
jgi:dCTP deaminase